MGGDIREIKLGSERELYNKYINHYVVVCVFSSHSLVVKREKQETSTTVRLY